MHWIRLFCLFVLAAAVTACQKRNCSDEVVCETVHRYGVPMEPEEWSERGQCGQVVSMRKDGVSVKRNYDCGVLHGECCYTFPHRDVVQKTEVYERGQLVQEQTHYCSGHPCKKIVYEGDDSHSTTVWYENGAPHAREKVEGGRLVSGEYYDIDQQGESRIENGSGYRTRRDGQGQLQSVDTIQEGQMVLSTTYHPNGSPAVVTPFVDGVIEGERRTYNPGGEPATIEKWSGNAQHGTMLEYEHGEKRAEVPYVNGKRSGIERRYRDDGKTLAQEITWVRGQKHGPAYSYIGNTTKTDWYFRDKLVANKATFDMMSNQ